MEPADARDHNGLDRRIRTRALGSLYLAGALIGAVSLVLPHSDAADDTALWSNVGLAVVGGLILFRLGPRFPDWLLHVSVASGTVLITRAVFESNEPVSFYSVWFIWIGMYAFYFFDRIAAAAHVAFASAMFALTLVHEPATSPLARWLTTVATLAVAGVFIDTLLRRARREASASAESARTMAVVAEVAQELARLANSAESRTALAEAAARVTEADGVALWEPAADRPVIVAAAHTGEFAREAELPLADRSPGLVRAFVDVRASVASGGAAGQMAVEVPGRQKPGAVLWQPVVRDGKSAAVLAFYWRDPSALSNGSVLTLASLLAAEVAVTLERMHLLARLESIARTDDLTGLPNRRALQEQLPRELARAGREARPLCVAFLDLDHFKLFNDEHGHQAGDRLLKQAAAAWSDQLRSTDVLSRYGGEEFVLALPSCPPDQAVRVIERLRAATPGGQTASAGMACWQHGESAAALLERADHALYEAKRGGRDRVVIAGTVEERAPSPGAS